MTWSGGDACMYVVDHVPRLVRVTAGGWLSGVNLDTGDASSAMGEFIIRKNHVVGISLEANSRIYHREPRGVLIAHNSVIFDCTCFSTSISWSLTAVVPSTRPSKFGPPNTNQPSYFWTMQFTTVFSTGSPRLSGVPCWIKPTPFLGVVGQYKITNFWCAPGCRVLACPG